MALAHFRMLIHEFLKKDPDIVPEEAPLIFLDRKSAMCMSKNGNLIIAQFPALRADCFTALIAAHP